MNLETLTVSKSELSPHLPREFILIGYASFEKRSTTIPIAVDINSIKQAIIFHSKGNNDSDSKKAINEHLGSLSKFIELDINDPISVARRLTEEVRLLCQSNTSIVIDITTFTHESLLMLLKLIYANIRWFESAICLYNGAEKYSVDDSPEQVWLSKGCKDVRNVLGYPGLIRPSAKTCLVLLSGFELERATKLIELIEPDKLILGSGIDPTNENHAPLMAHFSKEFARWQDSYKSIIQTSFKFSCKNVSETVDSINELIDQNPTDNYILIPLNTKLSTIATAIVALRNKQIQVCYSVPEIYNTQNYSTPSDNITIFPLKGMV